MIENKEHVIGKRLDSNSSIIQKLLYEDFFKKLAEADFDNKN